MYRTTASAGEKWRQACAFYQEDLKSGFVRLQMELMGASFHDEALRREFVPRWLAWHKLVEAAVADFIAESDLELPVSARAISSWIAWFWIGMEASMTLGITERQGHQREALDAVAALLRGVESGDEQGFRKSRKEAIRPRRPRRSLAAIAGAAGGIAASLSVRDDHRPVEGFVERDGVRSWFGQFGERGRGSPSRRSTRSPTLTC